jgi:sulfonate transport system substrate-binding protein
MTPQTSLRMKNRLLSRMGPLAAAALAAVVAAACSSSGSGSGSTVGSGSGGTTQAGETGVGNVTLHIGDQAGSGAEALLTAAGLIHKLPFRVTFSDFTSGPPMLQAMGAGAVDVGAVGNSPPVFAAAGGSQVTIVGALKSTPAGSAIVVPKNSPIHSIADLRGKKIAVAQGSSANYHILTVLQKAGLSVKDVTLNYLQPTEGQAALSSGAVDAWDIWTPFTEASLAKGARVLVTGAGYGSPYSFEVASKAALADPAKADAIRAYLKIINQAHLWANTHPDDWAKVWAQGTGLPESIMLTAAKDAQSVPIPITPAVVSSEQHIADAYQTAGLIPGKVDLSNFVVTRFNSTANGTASTAGSSS